LRRGAALDRLAGRAIRLLHAFSTKNYQSGPRCRLRRRRCVHAARKSRLDVHCLAKSIRAGAHHSPAGDAAGLTAPVARSKAAALWDESMHSQIARCHVASPPFHCHASVLNMQFHDLHACSLCLRRHCILVTGWGQALRCNAAIGAGRNRTGCGACAVRVV
jgi:hypothetical protein